METHFQMKGFAPRLALKKGTRQVETGLFVEYPNLIYGQMEALDCWSSLLFSIVSVTLTWKMKKLMIRMKMN